MTDDLFARSRIACRSGFRFLVWSTALVTGVVATRFGLKRWAPRYLEWSARVVPEMRTLFLEERGLRRAGGRRHDDAVRDIEEAIRLAPDDPQVLLTMAKAYEDLRMPEQAVVFYERAVMLPGSDWSDTFRASLRERIARLRRETRQASDGGR
jgi:hypothetical protein